MPATEPTAASTIITSYPNGPLIVQGDFAVLDHEGNEFSTCRRAMALCRCGRSQSAPLCDGTHKAGKSIDD